jgi:hypothetical protein
MSDQDSRWGNTARALEAPTIEPEAERLEPEALEPEPTVAEPASRSYLDELYENGVDSFEIPAAVLCAVCGHPDCEGCISEDDGNSGVIAIVPWERPGGAWTRLWSTANATTVGAEAFFGALPRGAVEPALTFALVAEGLAVTSVVTVLLAGAMLLFPDLAVQLIFDTQLARDAGRWLAVGIPSVTLWMVAVHSIHALVANRGAHRHGAPNMPRRALRFGLYACGWDLMTSPFGILVTLFSRGPSSAGALFGAAVTVPAKATQALLRGAYRLDDKRARRVHRQAVAAAMVVTVLSVAGVVLAAMLS